MSPLFGPAGYLPVSCDRQFQFSLSTVFFCVTAVAVNCAASRYLSYWIVLPYGCLLASRILAKLGSESNSAWGLLAIGWIFALGNICASQLSCFLSSDAFDYPDETARSLLLIYLTGIAFPLVCSTWAIPSLLEAFVNWRSRSRKWLLLFLTMANLDLAIVAYFVVSLVRKVTWD